MAPHKIVLNKETFEAFVNEQEINYKKNKEIAINAIAFPAPTTPSPRRRFGNIGRGFKKLSPRSLFAKFRSIGRSRKLRIGDVHPSATMHFQHANDDMSLYDSSDDDDDDESIRNGTDFQNFSFSFDHSFSDDDEGYYSKDDDGRRGEDDDLSMKEIRAFRRVWKQMTSEERAAAIKESLDEIRELHRSLELKPRASKEDPSGAKSMHDISVAAASLQDGRELQLSLGNSVESHSLCYITGSFI